MASLDCLDRQQGAATVTRETVMPDHALYLQAMDALCDDLEAKERCAPLAKVERLRQISEAQQKAATDYTCMPLARIRSPRNSGHWSGSQVDTSIAWLVSVDSGSSPAGRGCRSSDTLNGSCPASALMATMLYRYTVLGEACTSSSFAAA